MGLLRVGDTFYALRFLRLLTTPWNKTGAYKAGIVDENGKKIKNPETTDEKKVYTIFHRLVFNLKRLLNKIPFGKKTISSYIAALFLIKEHTGLPDTILSAIIKESIGLNPLGPGQILAETFETDSVIEPGQYELQGVVFSRVGDEINGHGKKVKILESSHKAIAGEIFGCTVYRGILVESGLSVLLTKENLKFPNQ